MGSSGPVVDGVVSFYGVQLSSETLGGVSLMEFLKFLGLGVSILGLSPFSFFVLFWFGGCWVLLLWGVFGVRFYSFWG